MPLIKKKISELPLADSLKGLYTIGYKIIDGIKTSVKVSLEDIQTAYQDVVNAIKKSEEATSNANNAAVIAEEKAAAANTAALNAEKVANNPTYIGKDHYVYVYNKDTESFDKTDIYCKGEPGSSFRVAGEYATLEALKSAVPDGSAVDGFMAVGTEAPYDYYAWVNGEWVSQGKIGGMDEAPTDGKAYGRKNKDWVEVLEKSKTVEYKYDLREADLDTFKGSGGDIAFIGIQRNNKFATPENHYPLEEAGTLIVAGTITDKTNQIYHTYNSNRIFIRSATSKGENGSFSDWVELAKVTDVLTKTNTSSFTPTGDYQPATKEYADNIGYGKVINADSGTISKDLIGNGLNLTGVDAEERVNRYFGNLSNFRSVVQDIIENHTRYFIHNSNDCRELGCLNTWKNTGNTEHELHFILTGFGDGNLHTKRYSIRITENTDDARFIIVNIISSDNLTTLTKKTAAEYEAIGSKDANTAYCVTD